MYDEGWGVPENDAEAVQWYPKFHAATKRHHKFYRCGDGTIARDRQMIGQGGPVDFSARRSVPIGVTINHAPHSRHTYRRATLNVYFLIKTENSEAVYFIRHFSDV